MQGGWGEGRGGGGGESRRERGEEQWRAEEGSGGAGGKDDVPNTLTDECMSAPPRPRASLQCVAVQPICCRVQEHISARVLARGSGSEPHRPPRPLVPVRRAIPETRCGSITHAREGAETVWVQRANVASARTHGRRCTDVSVDWRTGNNRSHPTCRTLWIGFGGSPSCIPCA